MTASPDLPSASKATGISGGSSRLPSRIVLVGLLAIILGMGAAWYDTVRNERAARMQVEVTSKVLLELRQSLRAGLNAETGQRGYLLTGDDTYLEPFFEAERNWLPLIDELERSLADVATPAHVQGSSRLRDIATAKLAELRETIDLAKSGNLDAALELVRTDLGQGLMQEFRAEVAALEAAEEAQLSAAIARADRSAARSGPILAILALALVALAAIGFRLEQRAQEADYAARDMAELRAARAKSDLLARELNHRVKNLFAVILALVNLSGRGQTDVKAVIKSIRERIHALSVAHAVSQGQLDQKTVALQDVIEATLAPHQSATNRIQLDGPKVELDVRTITPLGLLMHELATNASKYGGLSTPQGCVNISWNHTDDGALVLHWVESRGPSVEEEGTPGFGSVMIRQAVSQLGGTIDLTWESEGLRVSLRFPAELTHEGT